MWVSSLISKVPVFVAYSRTNYRNPGSGRTIPMFVMAGSIKIAATSLYDSYLFRPSKSLNSTTLVVSVGSTAGATNPGLGLGLPSSTTTNV